MNRNKPINRKSVLITMTIILFVIVISGLSVFFANGRFAQNETDSIKYVIGVSQFNLNESWLVEINHEIEQAQKGNDSVRLIFTDAGGSSQKQAQDIDDLIGMGIDLLIISPNDTVTLNEKIADVHRKVPVIVMQRAIPAEDYTTYITTDNYKLGYEAGLFIANLVNGKATNIIEVVGKADSLESKDRSAGFQEALAGNANLKIIKTVEGDWLQDTTEDTLAEMFMDMPNVDIIFAHNDAMAIGAYNAAKKMRLPLIRVIGIGGLADQTASISLVKDGILEYTCINTLGGTTAYDTALEILSGKSDIPKQIVLDSQMVTKDTLEELKNN